MSAITFRPTHGAAASPSSGFSARIHGASIADLVQMECASRARRVIRVTSTGSIGYLYFRDGRLIHALTPDAVGERAALEILQYRHGSFEPCVLEWPPEETIHSSAAHLLLLAAQLQDETVHDETQHGNLVEFPNGRAGAGSLPPAPAPAAPRDELQPPSSRQRLPAVTVPSSAPMEIVRVDRGGSVVQGDATTPFAGMAAYAARLGELIGQSLGLGALESLQCQLSRERCWVIADEQTVVAVRTDASLSMSDVRRALELLP
jgi:hypothetical protein